MLNSKINIMPNMDGTAPEGKGRAQGRKLGRCHNLSDEENCRCSAKVWE